MDLGERGYAATYRMQKRLVALRQRGRIPDTMVVVEHPPCLTLGRAARVEHILADRDLLAAQGITVHSSDRGGDVTYHGPGQLVCYAVCDLARSDRDVHRHARRLEEVMIRTAAAFGVTAWREAGYPGVWSADGKLGAVGIAVRRWVTLHGAALNVAPDMSRFSFIVPCGLRAARSTSLERVLGTPLDAGLVRSALRAACADVFDLRLIERGRMAVPARPSHSVRAPRARRRARAAG